MDRMEEYRALQRELEQTPAALEGTLQRARARQRRERRGWRAFGASFGGVAAVFALFVVLVNVSGPFAAACESIPILKDLAAAVSFSHSLSSAVDHGYVQTIGQSQSDNGVTVDLEYMMLDGGQIVFFGRVDAPEDVTSCMVVADLPADDGGKIQGCGLTSQSIKPGELTTLFTIAVDPEVFVFPEVLHLACKVELRLDGGNLAPTHTNADSPEELPPDAEVSFDVPVDRALLGQSRSVPVDRWIELEGNRFYISSLELYPTSARFTLEADESNPDTLQTLSYYVEDEHGNRYESGSASGVFAMGDTYWFESPYFQEPEHLTLHITGTVWMEKGRERVSIDLETGEALGPLPVGVRPFVDTSAGTEVGLTAPLGAGSTENHSIHYQVMGHHYYAPDGTEFEINGISTVSGNPHMGPVDEAQEAHYEGTFTQTIFLRNWEWDTVELELYYSRRADYVQSLSFELT